jgi:hypothetical protein
MFFTKKKIPIIKIISFVIAILLCLSCFAPIASAEGSLYIFSYLAYISTSSNGKVLVTFDITGTGTMDVIGATDIIICENGTDIKTYSSSSTSGMMASNKVVWANTITHNGTVGKEYSATVIFKSGVNGGYDNRLMDTNTVTAKK